MSQLPLILYIETNYLMGMATGRDTNLDELLSDVSKRLPGQGQVRVVSPLVCIMEALKALESVQSERNQLERSLERRISQLSRDKTSEHAGNWLSRLESAKVANAEILEVTSSRLFEAIRFWKTGRTYRS